MREAAAVKNANSLIFRTMLKGNSLYNPNSIFISPIYPFLWRET